MRHRLTACGSFVVALAVGIAACAPAPGTRPSATETTPAATFVIPKPTEEPATQTGLAGTSYARPDIERELKNFFDLFYKARTLPRGAQFDVAALRGLVEGAYADYTLPLFDREIRDAQSGSLQEVTFTDIAVSRVLPFFDPAGAFQGRAEAFVTRTRIETRAGSAPTRETATYQFRLSRHVFGADGVRWTAYDFLEPGTSRFVSQEEFVSETKAATELQAYFADFYAARSLSPGHPIDYDHSISLVGGNYSAYTTPLLMKTRDEAASGALKEVRYADIAVKLQKWDANATYHGGLASVVVTRTAFVTRSTGAGPPQTETYQFRVHRHSYGGIPYWLAVDFFRPDVGRWVTEIAGATVIVPEAGHG